MANPEDIPGFWVMADTFVRELSRLLTEVKMSDHDKHFEGIWEEVEEENAISISTSIPSLETAPVAI